MSIEGQISRAEAAQLLALARDSTPQTAIGEIGTYRGRSTAALAFGSLMGSRNRVYAVDPHVEFVGVLGGTFGAQDQAALYRNLAMARIGEVVAVVCLPSDAAARAWSQKNVGLLWIDGDHRYEAVRKDYHSWHDLLARDETVAFHDRSHQAWRDSLLSSRPKARFVQPARLEIWPGSATGRGKDA